MSEQCTTLCRATTSIPELGARAGDLVAGFANNLYVVRELPRMARSGWVGVRVVRPVPELAGSLRALR